MRIVEKLVLLVALLSFHWTASAQYEIGVGLGATSSHTNLSMGYYDYGSLGGFSPELRASYSLTKHFKANMSLGYNTIGFKAKPVGEDEIKVKLGYFSLPVFASLSYPLCQKFSVGALAGLRFNFKNSISSDYPFVSDFSRLNHTVGFVFGGLAEYKLCNQFHLNAQYRINPDLGDADKDDKIGRLAYHSFLLGLSYVIPSKK